MKAVPRSSTAWTGRSAPHATSTGPRPRRRSVDDVIKEFLEAVDRGDVSDRHGHRFTPGAVRELHWCLRGHVSEAFGAMNLRDVRRLDVEDLVYELGDSGLSGQRLRAVVTSVRALYDYAAERHLVEHNPASRVALPDEDDAAQPTGRPVSSRPIWAGGRWSGPSARRRPASPPPEPTAADRAISLGLLVGTLGFALVALILFAESL